MKIARYQYKSDESYGIIDGNTIVSLPLLSRLLKKQLPHTLEEFISRGERATKTVTELLTKTKDIDIEKVSLPLKAVTILAPIAFPPKIICLGLNYIDHAAETSSRVPDEPIIFMKPHTAIIGSNQKIVKPKFVKELDYEGELGLVIGQKTKNVEVKVAKKSIFGYTIFNDVSARDFQFKDGQWTRGKSFDTFAPTGPYITTENELCTDDLAIRTWVNGEPRQNGTTRNMVFNVNQIVHHLSRVMTLEPCDIIATGTPAGVGHAMKPRKYLQHGDRVRIEIEGIGVLENPVEEQDK